MGALATHFTTKLPSVKRHSVNKRSHRPPGPTAYVPSLLNPLRRTPDPACPYPNQKAGLLTPGLNAPQLLHNQPANL